MDVSNKPLVKNFIAKCGVVLCIIVYRFFATTCRFKLNSL